MSDWTDEVRDRLLAPSTVSGTWGAPEDGPWCVKREADIRAALGEIERLQSIEDAHVGCVAGNWAERALKAEVRAKAAEAEVERLKTALRDIALLDHHEHGPAGKGSDLARAALRGGGEPKAHADDCPCVMCDPMQVRLDQQLRALRGGGK